MKVYITDSRLVFGTYEIPSAQYFIEWNKPVGDSPTKFRLRSVNNGSVLLTENFLNITDCTDINGNYYTGYDDFILAIGSFFVRALTVFEGELDALLEQIAMHVEIDTLGSRQRYIK